MLEALAVVIKQEKKINDVQLGKEKLNCAYGQMLWYVLLTRDHQILPQYF